MDDNKKEDKNKLFSGGEELKGWEEEIKYSKDGVIAFTDSNHQYTNIKTNKVLLSVSGLIKKFSSTDFSKVAEKYAKKNGLKTAEVLEDWAERGRIACIQGTALHLPFEEYEQTGTYTLPIIYKKSRVVDKVINELFVNGPLEPVGSEIIVYNKHYAGQIDNVSKTAANESNKRFILDYKTNKSISDYSMDNTRMKGPFKHLRDTNLSKYSLQLGFYREMYEAMTGDTIDDCFLIHILVTKWKRLDIIKIDRGLIREVLRTKPDDF